MTRLTVLLAVVVLGLSLAGSPGIRADTVTLWQCPVWSMMFIRLGDLTGGGITYPSGLTDWWTSDGHAGVNCPGWALWRY